MQVVGEVRAVRQSDDGKMVFLTVLEQDTMQSVYAFADVPGLDVVKVGDTIGATVVVRPKQKESGELYCSTQLRTVEVLSVAGDAAAPLKAVNS